MSGDVKTEKLLRAADVGRIINCSKRSVYRYCSSGRIPAPVRIGGAIRWRLSDIELFLRWDCPNREEFEIRRESGEKLGGHR